MADNVAITAGTGTTIAADDIGGGVLAQRVKAVLGADGTGVDPSAGAGVVGTGVQRTTIARDCDFGTPIKYITVAMTPEATALDVGDVVADTQIVAACTRGDDLPSILHSLTFIDIVDQKAKLRFVFFDANTSLGTEDAAPDIDDTEVLTVIGTLDIAVADYVDLGGASVVHKSNIGMVVKPASGTDDIYMAIYSPDTSTPTYGANNLTVRLGFIS